MAVRGAHSGMQALMADSLENLIDVRRVAADVHLRHAVGRGGPFVILPHRTLAAAVGGEAEINIDLRGKPVSLLREGGANPSCTIIRRFSSAVSGLFRLLTMDHLDSFTYRNASPGGQILDTYNDNERARIRAVLLDYGKENRLSVENIFKRLCAAEHCTPETVGFSFKTFQRLLAGAPPVQEGKPLRRGDKAVAAAARFAKGLPNRPDAFHALGQALHALYKRDLSPAIAGSYTLTLGENISTQISISAPAQGFALVREKHTAPVSRFHDGVLVSTGLGKYLILSRDRLMLLPRYIATAGTEAFVYDHAGSLYPGEAFVDYTAIFTRARE